MPNVSMSEQQTDICQYNYAYIERIDGIAYLKGSPVTGVVCYYEGEKLIGIISYVNGMPEGVIKMYYESGKLRQEFPHKNGMPEGIEKFYYESGIIERETPYKEGMKEGIHKQYYESGTLKSEALFKNGMLEGHMKFYREDGTLGASIEYKNGFTVSGICHDIDGTTRPWTNVELTNWQNGLNVNCSTDNQAASAESQPQTRQADKTVYHTVKSGDTLYSIAKTYGVSVASIQKLNNISGNSIKTGQRIIIK